MEKDKRRKKGRRKKYTRNLTKNIRKIKINHVYSFKSIVKEKIIKYNRGISWEHTLAWEPK